MPTKYIAFFLIFILSGCGSQSTIDNATTPQASDNTSNDASVLNVAVDDWATFTSNATDLEFFKIGFVELIKRGELKKIEPLWDIDLAVDNISFNLSKIGKTFINSKEFKSSAEKTIRTIATGFCSNGESDWHYIGSTSNNKNVTTIHFRVMSNGSPQWCSFDIKKANNHYRIINSKNMNVNYSINDFFYDYDDAIQQMFLDKRNFRQDFWGNAPDSKTKTVINVSSGTTSREALLANMKESEIQDYGVMYLNWLIDRKRFSKARAVAKELAKEIPDNYFPAYSGYWIAYDEGNNQEAIKHLYQGLQYAPTDTLLYYFLLESTIADKNYELAVMTLNTLNNAFNYNLTASDINTIKYGMAFTRSDHYKNWKRTQ